MVGALVNAVFLFALCFSITVQAIKRFVFVEKIEDPKMILIVGGVGLLINIVGMVIFGHSHGEEGHGHSHAGGDSQDVHKQKEGEGNDCGGPREQVNRSIFPKNIQIIIYLYQA